jgi:hypothetical protein
MQLNYNNSFRSGRIGIPLFCYFAENYIMISDLGLTGVDHPAIAVRDVDKMAVWYCDILGYKKYFRHEKPVWMLRAPDQHASNSRTGCRTIADTAHI